MPPHTGRIDHPERTTAPVEGAETTAQGNTPSATKSAHTARECGLQGFQTAKLVERGSR